MNLKIETPQIRYKPINKLDAIKPLVTLPQELRDEISIVSQVLPFRVNSYVIDELIDWKNVPDDPMFSMLFPRREMLATKDYDRLKSELQRGASKAQINEIVSDIRSRLNPHPIGQMQYNVPEFNGQRLEGIQHKYHDTVLYFPARGQTCHAFCSFCYRWAQFIGDATLQFASRSTGDLVDYLAAHPEVSDVLLTGGDVMMMTTRWLAEIVNAILDDPRLEHITNIRIGTKSIAYWPGRFVTDPDADEFLKLVEQVNRRGRHLTMMIHINHWRELSTPLVQEAIRRLRSSGALLRSQSPVLRHVNDNPATLARMWREQVRLGIVPYYLFGGCDTGAIRFFALPLMRAWQIFKEAEEGLTGLAQTVRGPVVGTLGGKVQILGPAPMDGKEVIALQYVKAKNPRLMGRLFFAQMDRTATHFDQLSPASSDSAFAFQH